MLCCDVMIEEEDMFDLFFFVLCLRSGPGARESHCWPGSED